MRIRIATAQLFPVLLALFVSLPCRRGVSAATSPPATDPVLERGLQHTEQSRDVAESAIEKVNTLLSPGVSPLVPSWRTLANEKGRTQTTPVYLVVVRESAASSPAAVPRGCRCIFVDPALLDSWITTQSTGQGRLTLDPSYVLTFMLLHEVGHIVKGSSAVEFSNGEMTQLNIEPGVEKAHEKAADEFAAGVIRKSARKMPVSTASLTANWVANELTKIAWNMQAYRTLDQFGATAVGTPSVFFDQTYSHPNLAWRILRCNDLIQRTPVSRKLLLSFEQARQKGAEEKPLYQRRNR